jgi:hypothetical protein
MVGHSRIEQVLGIDVASWDFDACAEMLDIISKRMATLAKESAAKVDRAEQAYIDRILEEVGKRPAPRGNRRQVAKAAGR